MKLNLCLFLMLGIVISAHAQERNRPWSIGVFFSPDYCYRIISYSGDETIVSRIVQERETDDNEKAKVGFTIGILIRYSFPKRFGLESGITYSDKGFKYDNIPIMNGSISPDEPAGTADIKYHFRFFEFPIKATYTIPINSRISFKPGLGTFVDYYSNTKTKADLKYYNGNSYTEKTRERDDSGYKNFTIGICGSLAFDFYRGKRFDLRLEPNVRYGLQSIWDYPIDTQLYSIGINIGMMYKL